MNEDFTRVSDHVTVLRRHGWIIAVAATIGLLAGALLLPMTTSGATAQAVVLTPTVGDQAPTVEQVNTQVQLIESDTVVQDVIKNLGLDTDPGQLLDATEVAVVEETTTVTINATQDSPELAADVANAFAVGYLDAYAARQQSSDDEAIRLLRRQLRSSTEELLSLRDTVGGLSGADQLNTELAIARVEKRQGRLNNELSLLQDPATGGGGGSVLQEAAAPSSASGGGLRGGLLGLVLGLIVGTAIAYLRHNRDDSIRDEARLAQLVGGAPVLGRIPTSKTARAGGVGDAPGDPAAAEAYRTLATSLVLRGTRGSADSAEQAPGRLIAVASPTPGDGKTAVACNLALGAAAAGTSAVLVDADLRDPGVATLLGVDGLGEGLTDFLLASGTGGSLAKTDVGVQGLRVVTAGTDHESRHDLLASTRADEMVTALRRQDADLVVVDTAPLLHASETLNLATRCDEVLLVVRYGHTTGRDVESALARLELVRATVSGIVLTDVPQRALAGGGTYPAHPA